MESYSHKKDNWKLEEQAIHQREIESDDNYTYTISEVSELLKVSRQTIWNWVKAKKFNSFKFGSSIKSPVRIKKVDLDAYVERSKRNKIICPKCMM